MVLVVETRSQNPRLVLQQGKEPWETKIKNDWEKEEKLQKTFESMIQQMQTSKSIMENILGSQLPTEEPFGLSKTEIDFSNDGTITKKQDVLQEIN
jgi:hypothetical protein